ncbi:hypothetical protein EV426DRAFT_577421 [Tirmania nivea]|nr:hypothetical protein EV426DRAFT_577421 [Tirmania nivea]
MAEEGNQRKARDMMIFSALMILLYARNQQVNAYQTQMGVFMKASHMTSNGIDVLQGTGFCCSDKHVHNTMVKVNVIGRRTQSKKVRVSDGPGTREATMDNSTGGFDLGYSNQELLQRLYLVGGNQLLVGQVHEMLEYDYVENLCLRSKDDQDIIHENILLFVRSALEIRSYYKSMCTRDVTAMEAIMQLWTPQFIGARLMNYGDALMDIRVGMADGREWHEYLKQIVRYN